MGSERILEGRVVFEVVRAKKLGPNAHMDTYAVVRLSNKADGSLMMTRRTKTIDESNSPMYHSTMNFHFMMHKLQKLSDLKFEVDIWEHHKFTKDTLVGTCDAHLDMMERGEEHARWFVLESANNLGRPPPEVFLRILVHEEGHGRDASRRKEQSFEQLEREIEEGKIHLSALEDIKNEIVSGSTKKKDSKIVLTREGAAKVKKIVDDINTSTADVLYKVNTLFKKASNLSQVMSEKVKNQNKA